MIGRNPRRWEELTVAALGGLVIATLIAYGCGTKADVGTAPSGVTVRDDLPPECQVGSFDPGHFELQNGNVLKVWGLNTNPNAVAQARNIRGQLMEKACKLHVPYEWPDRTTGTAPCSVLSDGSATALIICTGGGSVEVAPCMHRSLKTLVCSEPIKAKVKG